MARLQKLSSKMCTRLCGPIHIVHERPVPSAGSWKNARTYLPAGLPFMLKLLKPHKLTATPFVNLCHLTGVACLLLVVATLSGDRITSDLASLNQDLPFERVTPQLAGVMKGDWIDHTDPVVRFALTLPEHWYRRVLNDEALEPDNRTPQEQGYAVTYLSPLTSDSDPFADYVMVELLPGESSGFSSDSKTERRVIRVDGVSALRERIELPAYPVDQHRIDLVAYQTIVTQKRYTLGIYVVGQHIEAAALDALFTRIIESFRLPDFSQDSSRQVS